MVWAWHRPVTVFLPIYTTFYRVFLNILAQNRCKDSMSIHSTHSKRTNSGRRSWLTIRLRCHKLHSREWIERIWYSSWDMSMWNILVSPSRPWQVHLLNKLENTYSMILSHQLHASWDAKLKRRNLNPHLSERGLMWGPCLFLLLTSPEIWFFSGERFVLQRKPVEGGRRKLLYAL